MANKTPKARFWYKQKPDRKRQRANRKKAARARRESPLLRLPREVRNAIYHDVLTSQHHKDNFTTYGTGIVNIPEIATTSLFFVNKQVSQEAREESFRVCRYRIHHSRLHTNRWTLNLATFARIRHLEVAWTRPIKTAAANKHVDPQILDRLPELRDVTFDLLAFQYLSVDSGLDIAALAQNLSRRFCARCEHFPRWMGELIGYTMAKKVDVCYRTYFFTALHHPPMTRSTAPVDYFVRAFIRWRPDNLKDPNMPPVNSTVQFAPYDFNVWRDKRIPCRT